jgi:hypothetical protein
MIHAMMPPPRAGAARLQLGLILVEINDKPVMLGFADLLDIIEHLDFETQPTPIDTGQFNLGTYAFAHRRRPHVAYGHHDPDLALARLQMRCDQLTGRSFAELHHRRRRKHPVLAALGGHRFGDFAFRHMLHTDFQRIHTTISTGQNVALILAEAGRTERKKSRPCGAAVVDQPQVSVGFLAVVFLVMDAPAFLILRMMQAGALVFGHCAVGLGLALHVRNVRLMAFKTSRFLDVELPGFDALVDAFLLHFLALVDAGG